MERQAAETLPFVTAEVQGPPHQVRQALAGFFNDGTAPPGAPNRFAPDDWLHSFYLYPARVPPGSQQLSLPDDFTLRHGAVDDPAMDRYLALDPSRRADDLYLYQPVARRWTSEYRTRGEPVEFSCQFVLHLEPVGEDRTRIEVIEFQPQVWAGKKWAFTAHGVGFGKVSDIRRVPPTTRDRVKLLERITAALGGQER